MSSIPVASFFKRGKVVISIAGFDVLYRDKPGQAWRRGPYCMVRDGTQVSGSIVRGSSKWSRSTAMRLVKIVWDKHHRP